MRTATSSTLALALLAAAAGGCATAGQQQQDPAYQQREVLDRSLVRSGEATLSEEAVQALLGSRVALPARAKLAVVALDPAPTAFGHRYPPAPGTSEYLQARKEFLETFERPLVATGRFVEVTHVPGLLLPPAPSLVKLREAAALMQAQLLLVYQTRTQLLDDVHLLAPDEVKAHGAIEVLLLDVRTGVIPYAETFEAYQLERQGSGDASLYETRKRADRAVTLRVIQLAADGVAGFLRASPGRS